ncbi:MULTISPECIES: peptidylprolyl isomerase [unclassified Aureispira]|uniref:peptidylprolyl isomerase n=1 Tax=unclassified Aureispira TaxID=2649989 RepID=UPI000695DDAB|nr:MULTISPECIES: peptidylprolyl isomerase [unclassified Aureispira]WMX15159.1 peptidylprolyl isomerase [Aureispira sp. CCB-E]
MKKIWILVLLWALGSVLVSAQRQQVDKVIGVVGNHIILQSDVEAQLKMLESQSQGADLPKDARWLVFDQLLANALMLAEAEQDSVVVGDMEVQAQLDSRVTQILAYMNNNPEKFKEFYGMTPLEMKDFMRDQMRDQLVQQRMQQQIMSSITITPKEVKEFFKNIPKDSLPYFNSEVELAEIVIKPKINPIEDAKARKMARNLMLQIVEDSVDFAVLAKKYSDDRASAALGGDLGVQPRGTLVPEFEAAAYQLKPNEVSEVVKSEFGYHIIQLINRLGNTINTRHILIRPDITTEDREKAYQNLDSIRNLILSDSITFAEGIATYSEEDFSKTRAGRIMNPMTGEPYFELGDLEPSIYFAIDGLNEGDITKVIEYETRTGDKQFRIVKLLKRTEPHVANLQDDYSKIRTAALESKKGRYIVDWIDKKIADNYIEIKMENLGDQLEEARASAALKKWFDANSVRP